MLQAHGWPAVRAVLVDEQEVRAPIIHSHLAHDAANLVEAVIVVVDLHQDLVLFLLRQFRLAQQGVRAGREVHLQAGRGSGPP